MPNIKYVIMKDRVMSGWGLAEGKDNILVFECDTWLEAEIVKHNALNRSDMVDVQIRKKIPLYDESTHLVEIKNKNTSSNWYKEGYFSSTN